MHPLAFSLRTDETGQLCPCLWQTQWKGLCPGQAVNSSSCVSGWRSSCGYIVGGGMGRARLLQCLVLSVDSLGTQELLLYRPDILCQLNYARGICLVGRPQLSCAPWSHSGDTGPLWSPGAHSGLWQTALQVAFVPLKGPQSYSRAYLG